MTPSASNPQARSTNERGERADDAHDTFRNELASVGKDGRRRWIFARQPSGRYYRARTAVSVGLLAFLLLAPFVTINGQPLMLLNVLERRIVLLGVLFRPQDFYLVVLIALTVLVTLVMVTVTFGRIWCGWLCPQTIFMEMVFRRIEYWIDGSAEQQLRRTRGPWTRDRVTRHAAKQLVFFALSFVIANVFLAWIIGAPALLAIVTDPPSRHLAGLAAILTFSGVFYAVFARFREQACVLACPYGRMLSALTDERTIMVTYDSRRGEPRGHLARAAEPTGDCVDCHQCVTVCPTGIDIRNGAQLECVACTACMDACDGVMQRIGRPRGLIRYASHAAIAGGAAAPKSRFPPRVLGYAAVWIVLVGAATTLLAIRPDVDVLVLRQPGTLYVVSGTGITNFYQVQAFNRTGRPMSFTIDVQSPAGATVTALGPLGRVGPYGQLDGRVMVQLPVSALSGPSTPVRFVVHAGADAGHVMESAFLGPAAGAQR